MTRKIHIPIHVPFEDDDGNWHFRQVEAVAMIGNWILADFSGGPDSSLFKYCSMCNIQIPQIVKDHVPEGKIQCVCASHCGWEY